MKVAVAAMFAMIGTGSILGNATQSRSAISREDTNTDPIDLGEVVVKGYRREMRGDTLCVTPTAAQKRVTQNGFELVRGAMLPGIRVDALNGAVSLADGGGVMMLINGRPVDKQDILALRPKDVARIEYLDFPGADYGFAGINGLINFVTKERTDGYDVGIATSNAATTLNGQNFLFAKYAQGASEFSLAAQADYTSLSKRRIDDHDSYLIGDVWEEVVKKGLDTRLRYTDYNFQLEYTYYRPNKLIFDVTGKCNLYYSPVRGHSQIVSENNGPGVLQSTRPYEKYASPTLSIYYKNFLTSSSALSANVVGVYRNTDYRYAMTQTGAVGNWEDLRSEYAYSTKGKRYTAIAEVKYYNLFRTTIGLAAGVRAQHSYTANSYVGVKDSRDRMHDSDIYAYVAAYGYLLNSKLTYYLGVGSDGRMISQNGQHSSDWIFRPQVNLIYALGRWRIQLTGNFSQQNPDLSQLSTSELQVNRFEVMEGNPLLKNWWKTRGIFRITGNVGPVTVQNTLDYNMAHKPVLPAIYPSSTPGVFVFSYANQKRMAVLKESLYIQGSLFEGLSISFTPFFTSYQSRGDGYSHNLNTVACDLNVDWVKGAWNLGLNWRTREKSLSGENYTTTGAFNNVYLTYSAGAWRFGVIGQHLFCKNGPTIWESTDNHWVEKAQKLVVPAQGNMILLSLTWNLHKGRHREQATIDIENDDTASGIVKY